MTYEAKTYVACFCSSDRKTSKMGFGTSVLEQGWSETPRHGEGLLSKIKLFWLDENHENWIPKTRCLNPPHSQRALYFGSMSGQNNPECVAAWDAPTVLGKPFHLRWTFGFRIILTGHGTLNSHASPSKSRLTKPQTQ